MTREQTIVLGFLAAAFVAGWVVHALTGRGERRSETRRPETPAPPPSTPADDGRLRQAIDESHEHLDAAVRSYVTAIAASLDELERRPEQRAASAAEAPPELGEQIGAALSDDAANDSMLSVVRADRDLSDREMDLTDWGFAYGVAWVRAREREPDRPGDAIAHTALRPADPVFRAYTAEATSEHQRDNGR